MWKYKPSSTSVILRRFIECICNGPTVNFGTIRWKYKNAIRPFIRCDRFETSTRKRELSCVECNLRVQFVIHIQICRSHQFAVVFNSIRYILQSAAMTLIPRMRIICWKKCSYLKCVKQQFKYLIYSECITLIKNFSLTLKLFVSVYTKNRSGWQITCFELFLLSPKSPTRMRSTEFFLTSSRDRDT